MPYPPQGVAATDYLLRKVLGIGRYPTNLLGGVCWSTDYYAYPDWPPPQPLSILRFCYLYSTGCMGLLPERDPKYILSCVVLPQTGTETYGLVNPTDLNIEEYLWPIATHTLRAFSILQSNVIFNVDITNWKVFSLNMNGKTIQEWDCIDAYTRILPYIDNSFIESAFYCAGIGQVILFRPSGLRYLPLVYIESLGEYTSHYDPPDYPWLVRAGKYIFSAHGDSRMNGYIVKYDIDDLSYEYIILQETNPIYNPEIMICPVRPDTTTPDIVVTWSHTGPGGGESRTLDMRVYDINLNLKKQSSFDYTRAYDNKEEHPFLEAVDQDYIVISRLGYDWANDKHMLVLRIFDSGLNNLSDITLINYDDTLCDYWVRIFNGYIYAYVCTGSNIALYKYAPDGSLIATLPCLCPIMDNNGNIYCWDDTNGFSKYDSNFNLIKSMSPPPAIPCTPIMFL